MIIEFFGISGVGKTTICKKYYEKFLNENKKVVWSRNQLYNKYNWFLRNIIKGLQILFFSIFNIKFAIKLFVFLYKLNIKSKKDLMILSFNGIHLKFLFKQCKSKECIYLFDEGVFQYIWAIYLRNVNLTEKNINYILNLYQYPNELIIIDANNETIVNRLINRSSKTKILESKDLYLTIEKMKNNMKKILKYSIKQNKEFEKQIYHIDNNEVIKDV